MKMRTVSCLCFFFSWLCYGQIVSPSEKNSDPLGQQDPKVRNVKMRTVSCLCFFFSWLCSGQIVSPSEKNSDPLAHLCSSDVRVDSHSSPSYLQITTKASKNRSLPPRSYSVHRGNGSNSVSSVSCVELYGSTWKLTWPTVYLG